MPTVNCTFCGVTIEKPLNQILRCRNNFCSTACHNAYQRVQRVGYINPDGYRVSRINGELTREHRWIMEQYLGRALLPSEDVHHLNGMRSDNRLENLAVIEHSAHSREHHPVKWDLERAIAIRAEGLSFYRIGKELGVDKGQIRRAFIRRGLHITGEDPHRLPKLSEALVKEIRCRHAAGASQSALAKIYSVSPATICLIIKGKTWKHVT